MTAAKFKSLIFLCTPQYFAFYFSTWISFVAGGKSRTRDPTVTATGIGSVGGGLVSAISTLSVTYLVSCARHFCNIRLPLQTTSMEENVDIIN
jgi:hypothetical protein